MGTKYGPEPELFKPRTPGFEMSLELELSWLESDPSDADPSESSDSN